MIKNDRWIKEQAQQGMIAPFEDKLLRTINVPFVDSTPKPMGTNRVCDSYFNEIAALSFGLSSYGYDIRLSPRQFKIFRHIPGTVVDPKNFNPSNLDSVKLQEDDNGDFFVIPANSYGLGVSLELIRMPSNVTAICLGKSTYARVGLICNATPLEAGWQGHITLEFSNSSSADCRIYANEGVCQLLFFEGEPCEVSYSDRRGKYQNQSEEITLPKV